MSLDFKSIVANADAFLDMAAPFEMFLPTNVLIAMRAVAGLTKAIDNSLATGHDITDADLDALFAKDTALGKVEDAAEAAAEVRQAAAATPAAPAAAKSG